MIWMVVFGAIAALVVYRSMRKPVDVLDEMAKTAGVPKEVLQMIGEEENKTRTIPGKSIPGATGPYGLSANNPMCCGNMMRMESTYSLIHFHGKPVRDSASRAHYMTSPESGIRLRKYVHTQESGLPPIFITKEYHYMRCRDEAPDAPGFSMGNA